MDTFIVLLTVSGVAFLALAVLNGFLIFYSYKTNKKFDLLLEKGKLKDLKEVLFKQIDKTKNQEEAINGVIARIKSLESISEKTFQKIGVVRFNPFNNLGGNQSFIIALLDGQNDGFVISSLFIKEGNRVYAKAVKNGKSEHSLSGEEQEALKRAMS
ncbi:MAG: DUF4446 family protein [Patescibacteria group bacterium]